MLYIVSSYLLTYIFLILSEKISVNKKDNELETIDAIYLKLTRIIGFLSSLSEEKSLIKDMVLAPYIGNK